VQVTGDEEGPHAVLSGPAVDVGVVVGLDVERRDRGPAGKQRQRLVEQGLPRGGVQTGGVGDDTVHVEDDRRVRRIRIRGGGARGGLGHLWAAGDA
jgi:hypothetical protein